MTFRLKISKIFLYMCFFVAGKAGIVEIESIQCYGETLSIVNLRSKPRVSISN